MSRDKSIEMLVKEHCRDELRIIGIRPSETLRWGIDGGLSDFRSDEEKKNDDQGQSARDKVRAYRLKLRDMPQSDFDALVKQHIDTIKTEQKRKEQQLFFNKPDADADFEYWGKIAGYKPEEAAALLLSKDPNKVNSESLRPYSQISDFPKKYTDSFTLVSRAVSMSELKAPIQPKLFLEWAKKKRIEFPSELSQVIEECSSDTEIKTYEHQQKTITILKGTINTQNETIETQKEAIETLLAQRVNTNRQLNDLLEKPETERTKQQTSAVDQQPNTLSGSKYWREFQSKTLVAIDAFPGWADEQKNKITSEKVKDWLKRQPTNADYREADLIKKILADIFNNCP
ncbi:MAG: hypothetical protein ABW118_10325 [Candidatus Thiodiazotropha sp.]